MLTFRVSVHILPPAQTTDNKTFDMTCLHSGDAIGSFCLYMLYVASLRFVLV